MSDAAEATTGEATASGEGDGSAEATAEAAAAAAQAEAAKGADGDKAGATTGGEADGGNVVWPDKWRELMSGGDEKVAEELGRYAEPGLIGSALVEAKSKIRAGLEPAPFPEDGDDKAKAAWRKFNSIPAEATGYLDKLPEGLVVEEQDKAGMEVLTEAMHAKNAPSDVVHAAMGAYYQHIENVLAERSERDAASKTAAEDHLNGLYGSEFRRNINDLDAWLGSAPDGLKDKILGARSPDDMPLGNDPQYLEWMIGQMRAINPLVTVPGLGGGDPALALDDEIAAIEKVMKDDNRAYQGDKPMQARYLTLLDARGKRK